jgi:hypothetical protein
MSLRPTSSSYSTYTLESIYSAFNNNLDYASMKYTDNNNLIQTIPLVGFLTNPNASNIPQNMLYNIYNGLKTNLENFINDVSNNTVTNYNLGIVPKFRIMICLPDGTVFFDSSKGNLNTYDNFIDKKINENHASRKYVQQSVHSKDGIGYETKWSSSTRAIDTYYSVRFGFSSTGIVGIIAFSYTNIF